MQANQIQIPKIKSHLGLFHTDKCHIMEIKLKCCESHFITSKTVSNLYSTQPSLRIYVSKSMHMQINILAYSSSHLSGNKEERVGVRERERERRAREDIIRGQNWAAARWEKEFGSLSLHRSDRLTQMRREEVGGGWGAGSYSYAERDLRSQSITERTSARVCVHDRERERETSMYLFCISLGQDVAPHLTDKSMCVCHWLQWHFKQFNTRF